MDSDRPVHPYWLRALQLLGTSGRADPFGRKFLVRMDALFESMRTQGAVWQFQPLCQALLIAGWKDSRAESVADHAEKIMLGQTLPQQSPAGTAVWQEIVRTLEEEVARGALPAWEPRSIPGDYTAGPRPDPRDLIAALVDELRGLGAVISISPVTADDAVIVEAGKRLGFSFPDSLEDFYRHQGTLEWSWEVALPDGVEGVLSNESRRVYGLADALRVTDGYKRELPQHDEVPSRFVVLSDREHDNAAWGYLYDADASAIVFVMGGKGIVDRYTLDVWGLVRQLLVASRDGYRAALEARGG